MFIYSDLSGRLLIVLVWVESSSSSQLMIKLIEYLSFWNGKQLFQLILVYMRSSMRGMFFFSMQSETAEEKYCWIDSENFSKAKRRENSYFPHLPRSRGRIFNYFFRYYLSSQYIIQLLLILMLLLKQAKVQRFLLFSLACYDWRCTAADRYILRNLILLNSKMSNITQSPVRNSEIRNYNSPHNYRYVSPSNYPYSSSYKQIQSSPRQSHLIANSQPYNQSVRPINNYNGSLFRSQTKIEDKVKSPEQGLVSYGSRVQSLNPKQANKVEDKNIFYTQNNNLKDQIKGTQMNTSPVKVDITNQNNRKLITSTSDSNLLSSRYKSGSSNLNLYQNPYGGLKSEYKLQMRTSNGNNFVRSSVQQNEKINQSKGDDYLKISEIKSPVIQTSLNSSKQPIVTRKIVDTQIKPQISSVLKNQENVDKLIIDWQRKEMQKQKKEIYSKQQQNRQLEKRIAEQATQIQALEKQNSEIKEQIEQIKKRQESVSNQLYNVEKQFVLLRSKGRFYYEDALKSQLEQTKKMNQVVENKNEEIFRLKELIGQKQRKIEQLINQSQIYELKRSAEKREAQQLHEIALTNKSNESNSLKHYLQTVESRLKSSINENREKDEFIQHYLISRIKSIDQKQQLKKVVAKYQQILEQSKLVKKLRSQQDQIKKLQQKIKAFESQR